MKYRYLQYQYFMSIKFDTGKYWLDKCILHGYVIFFYYYLLPMKLIRRIYFDYNSVIQLMKYIEPNLFFVFKMYKK